MRLAFFGGVYNNYLALEAAIADARARGADSLSCLGDLGAFGPHPDRVFSLLWDHDVQCIQGNYDHSIGHGLEDCQCGYTDPRDNHFAQISYDYTLRKTSSRYCEWMTNLPTEVRIEVDDLKLLGCHGSPRKTNEFLWESTTSTAFLEKLADDYNADIILGTHTGIHWQRELSRGRRFVNAGVLGRPENDGNTHVWYTLLHTGADALPFLQAPATGNRGHCPAYHVEFVPLHYDHERLAAEMVAEKLPAEFVETTRTGWWTTCLEVLPSRERRRGRY